MTAKLLVRAVVLMATLSVSAVMAWADDGYDLWLRYAPIESGPLRDAYRQAIEGAGLEIEESKENPYRFISERAQDASAKYGVKSVSIRARKA